MNHLISRIVSPLVVCVAAVLLSSVSMASESSEGKALYSTCVSCHGDQAQGSAALGAPALAGQQSAYLQRQIKQFQTGLRGGDGSDSYSAQMPAVVAGLSPAQVISVSDYLNSLAPVKVAVAAGDLRKGNNYYHASCGGCHGGKAEGNEILNAPRLAGLSEAYLKRQFNHFKTGHRGSDASDRFGRQMKMMAQVLPDDATVNDVIAYITAQSQ